MIRSFLTEAKNTPFDLASLAEAWRVTRIRVRVSDAAPLAQDPALGGRLRGALGHRLREGASQSAAAGKPCDWDAPCAYDVMFNSQGRITARLEIPKPWALATYAEGQDLQIALSLLGVAGDWAGEVSDALIRGLRGGIETGRGKRDLAVAERRIETQGGIALPDPNRPVMLQFRSPLMLRQGGRAHGDPASLLKSIGNRISGLARWQGGALVLDGAVFGDVAEQLGRAAVWEEARTLPGWDSLSTRQNRAKPMGGVLGDLLLPPPGPAMALLLALGETAQAGSHTTHGLGRYVLISLP